MGCAMGTVRYILFFFNFLLALAGLGILALGIIIIRSDGATLNDVVQGNLTTPAIMFSIVGAFVFIFAFFGCCGALRESHCMICTYAVLLLTLLLLQVAVAVFAYTNKGKSRDLVEKGLNEPFEKYNKENKTKVFIDTIQQQYQCCGSTDTNTPWSQMQMSPPPSCFPNGDASKPAYNVACIPRLEVWVEDSMSKITHVAIIVAIVQAVGILFSLCLANSIRRQELRGYA